MLLKRGVHLDAIKLEKKSANTLENAYFCIPIIKNLGVSTINLLTSDFHMPRALYLFEAVFAD